VRQGAGAALAVALAGCGGGAPRTDGQRTTPTAAAAPAARRSTAPALCAALTATVTGHVRAAAATELSGLVLSRSQRGVLWTHNDSGDRPRVFAVAPSGRLLAEVAIAGADAVDWEDIAIGPAPGGGDALYIADTGDNAEERADVTVYRVPEPRLPATSAPATRLTLRYPDGAHDAEALLVDRTGTLTIVTKSFDGDARVYVAAAPAAGATTVLRRRGRLDLGVGGAVTAGDLSADGRTIVLRTYDRAFVWTRRAGESVAAALRGRRCSARNDLFAEGQGEAIALTAGASAFYTVPEGNQPAIRRYAPPARANASG
jgi:hypothetical protein